MINSERGLYAVHSGIYVFAWINIDRVSGFFDFLAGLGKLILAKSNFKSWLAYLNCKKAVDYQKLIHATVLMEICIAGHFH